MVNKKFLILFLALLIVGMSVAVAADVDDSTSAPTKKVTKDTTKVVKNSAVTKQAIKTADNKAVNKAKKTTKVTNKTKDDSKTVKSDVQADETTSINKKLENNINVDDSTVKEDTLNLSKKIIKNVKTDESEVDEGQSYTVTVSGKELVYTVYNNGTLVLHINDATLSRQVQFEMYSDNTRPKLPITVTNLGVNITDVVIDIQAFSILNTPAESYRGICAMFEDENVNYSSMNLIIQGNQKSMSTKKVNIVLGNPQLWDGTDPYEGLYKSVTIENMNYVISNLHNVIFIKDNVTLRNCSFTHSGPDDPTGSLVSISTVDGYSVNNVLIENCNFKLTMNMAGRVVNRESYIYMFEQGYWTEDQLNEMLTAMNEHGIYVKGQNVTMHNNTIDVTTINKNFEEDINNYDYALAVNGEDFTFTNNEFTNQYVRSVYLNGTNAILENNTITSLSDDTAIDITKSGNIVRYNSLSAVDVEGDIAVNTTGDNVVRFNQFTDTELKIISGTTANYNESLPITVILKDKVTGVLIGGVDVLVSVGDSPAETFTTDDYGMFTYDFISTTPGNVTFTVKREGNEFFGESEASVEITVGEDKDAIIADLNKTVQEQNQTIASQEEEIDELNEILDEQDTQIETLENTTQALNSTVSQLEKDLTQAQEQLAKNNNTNTNGSSSNNGTSNTNTTTPTKTSVTLKVNPATIYTGSKTKITATLKDANGKAVASQKISIKVGSKTYTVKTNKKGVATKTVKVTKTGKNKVTATFKATSKYAKATKSATLTVKAKEKTKITVTKLAYKNKKITIKATIKAGKKALTQNTKLTVKVDGKTLSSKKVSKKGKISLTFSKALKKGSYKVQIISKATSMYKQAKVTKTLKVNA